MRHTKIRQNPRSNTRIGKKEKQRDVNTFMAKKLREPAPPGMAPQSMFNFVFERFMQGSKGQYDLENIEHKHHLSSRRRLYQGRLTRGTPMKMTLFNADSRISAALFTAAGISISVSFCVPLSSRVDLVTKRYKCPTAEGRLTVSKVQVYK